MVTRWHMVWSFRDICCSVLFNGTRAAVSLRGRGPFPLLYQPDALWSAGFPLRLAGTQTLASLLQAPGIFPFVLYSSSSCSVSKFTHTDMLIRSPLKTWGLWKTLLGQLSSLYSALQTLTSLKSQGMFNSGHPGLWQDPLPEHGQELPQAVCETSHRAHPGLPSPRPGFKVLCYFIPKVWRKMQLHVFILILSYLRSGLCYSILARSRSQIWVLSQTAVMADRFSIKWPWTNIQLLQESLLLGATLVTNGVTWRNVSHTGMATPQLMFLAFWWCTHGRM